MKHFLLAALLATASLVRADVGEESASPDLNVNSRYTVESVVLASQRYQLSGTVLNEMQRLVGERLNMDALNGLSQRITQELRARSVTFRVSRGLQPAQVRVTFEVEKRPTNFDISLSNLTYNSREGWTGTGQATLTAGANAITMAGLSNGDDLVERYSGIRLRYDRLQVGGNRVRLGFEFDNFREQYSGTLSNSSLGAGAYSSRKNFEPSATFLLAKPLTLTVGLSFESMQTDSTAARPDSANAIATTLRYHDRWGESDANSQDLDAAYRLRAATTSLGSDFAYTRHAANARYAWRRFHQSVEVAVMAGVIYGRAPLFERFVLGNNTTLRGWNKYDLDPLGGNRAVHASVTYGYHIMRVFYDTGSVWDSGKHREEKHSAGIGVNTGLGSFGKNALLLAVAFPIRSGHMEPMLIAGMNF